MENIYKLCYVDEGRCFFTPRDLDKQWGDDWNDRPYEHNAGYPYTEQKGEEVEIKKLIIEPLDFATIQEPCQGYHNSPYSVEDINSGKVPWLEIATKNGYTEKIFAGISIEDFVSKMEDLPIVIYTPLKK